MISTSLLSEDFVVFVDYSQVFWTILPLLNCIISIISLSQSHQFEVIIYTILQTASLEHGIGMRWLIADV